MDNSVDIIKDLTIEFVDLALPSGTKWAKDYLRDKDGNVLYLPYEEAAKMSIPTKEQFNELVSVCRIIQDNTIEKSGCSFLGTNGKYVHYLTDSYLEAGKKQCSFFPETWLKDEEEGSSEKIIAHFFEEPYISHEFMGLGYPIVLVDNNI